MYMIIVGSIIVMCQALAWGGGAMFAIAILRFFGLVVAGKWDRRPQEYGNGMRKDGLP